MKTKAIKASLALLTFLISSATAVVQGEGEYDFKTTLPILSDKFHTSCNLHSGLNLTMVHCADQFEVYDTSSLEEQNSLLTNYGEKRAVTAVHNSLRTDDRHTITFLEGNKVHRLYRDESKPDFVVNIEHYLSMKIAEGDFAVDAWVLDGVVAVRINGLGFQFFLEPLVSTQEADPIKMVARDDGLTPFDYSKLYVYSFAPNKGVPVYTLFGVLEGAYVKIVYSFDPINFSIVEDIQIEEKPEFDGTHVKIEVTDEFVIVSQSNGAAPGVYFFDQEWNLVEYFSRDSLDEAPYNMEVHHIPELKMFQVFLAGPTTISIIEESKDRDGKSFFYMNDEVFISNKTQPFPSDQTYVAKSANFLVVKQSSDRSLGLMPICPYKYSYQKGELVCRPCETGLKSYGLQEEECITCMRAWVLGGNSDFKKAQYEQFCHDGYIFSIVLFAVVPFITLAIAVTCCCFAPGSGIRGNDHACDDGQTEMSQTTQKHRRHRQRQEARYVRRITKIVREDGQTVMTGTTKKAILNTSGGVSQRLDTEAPMMTEEANPGEVEFAPRTEALYNNSGSRNIDGRGGLDRYEDNGESEQFSDTDSNHFSARDAHYSEAKFGGAAARDPNLSVESCQARRDITNREVNDIRQTTKTNTRKD